MPVPRFLVVVLLVLLGGIAVAADQPVAIVDHPVSGHIHPSICRTPEGVLIVVYKGANVLMCARSLDQGATWEKPFPIATSAKRPDVIRKVKIFEVYPGTADTLPDGRVLVTWNYIANDKATDGYYERALLYSLSSDQGKTWTEQGLIGPVEDKHLGAVRHNVLPWGAQNSDWLLPLRAGPPRVFDPQTKELEVFSLAAPNGKQYSFQQITRTAEGTLLAMGPEFLRSTDEGKKWEAVQGFPAEPKGDSAEGRYLTALSDGRVIVTWGVGSANKGLRFNISSDDGKTWSKQTTTLLPDTPITARYYSARACQLDEDHVGVVFMNRSGVHFLKVAVDRIASK